MDIQTAKQIRIADYLHSLGYSPVKQQGVNLWYKSPLREEAEASFKVNTEREQWYDFGLGKGGGIIELAAHLYATDHVPYILKRIAEQTPHVRPVSFSFGKQNSSEPSFQQLEIVPLSSTALLAYLQGRGINIKLAKRECSEARFTHNGKRYFAIAFPNGSCGYEIRNRYFKGCIAPKEISHIRQSGKARNTCYVFEGFMDYLSFLTLRQESCPNYPELRKRVDEAIKLVGMQDYVKRSPSALSGGQKQRVSIAGVIAMLSDCIIFDEPTAMLDPKGRADVMNIIHDLNKKYKKTVVHITHYMEEAALADRIIVLNKGE